MCLYSRPSFFGGFVSTRKASALPTWKPAKPAEAPATQAEKQKQHSKATAASTVKPAGQPKPTPPPNPAVIRKERLKSSRNFDSDSDTEADNGRARQQQTLSNLEQKLAAAEKEADAKRPPPKPQHAQQAQQAQQLAYSSPYSHASKPGASKTRILLPKGKAGAASRNMALAPQVSIRLSVHLQCTKTQSGMHATQKCSMSLDTASKDEEFPNPQREL